MTDYHLYCVTVACPSCSEVTQFVVTRENPVPVDHDINIGKSHCPECGVHIPRIGEWDLRAEHEITTVANNES